jgi:hypothetical protein
VKLIRISFKYKYFIYRLNIIHIISELQNHAKKSHRPSGNINEILLLELLRNSILSTRSQRMLITYLCLTRFVET